MNGGFRYFITIFVQKLWTNQWVKNIQFFEEKSDFRGKNPTFWKKSSTFGKKSNFFEEKFDFWGKFWLFRGKISRKFFDIFEKVGLFFEKIFPQKKSSNSKKKTLTPVLVPYHMIYHHDGSCCEKTRSGSFLFTKSRLFWTDRARNANKSNKRLFEPKKTTALEEKQERNHLS